MTGTPVSRHSVLATLGGMAREDSGWRMSSIFQIKDLFDLYYPSDAPNPRVFGTAEDGIWFEWRLGGWCGKLYLDMAEMGGTMVAQDLAAGKKDIDVWYNLTHYIGWLRLAYRVQTVRARGGEGMTSDSMEPVDGRKYAVKFRDILKMNVVRCNVQKRPMMPRGRPVCRDFDEDCPALNEGGENDGRFAISISKQTPYPVLFVDADVDIGTLPEKMQKVMVVTRERKPGVWGAKCMLHECACCISKNESGMPVHQQQQQRYEVEGASGGLNPAGTSGGGGGNPK